MQIIAIMQITAPQLNDQSSPKNSGEVNNKIKHTNSQLQKYNSLTNH